MRFELWLLLISSLLIYDTYHEGKYSKLLFSYKKYYKIFVIIGATILIYFIFRRSPEKIREFLESGSGLLTALPISKQQKDLIASTSYLASPKEPKTYQTLKTEKEQPEPTKRNVSETKKKYVASSQSWKCSKCKNMLDHTFEIDHVIALKDGGSNETENLEALCPSCHRKKSSYSFL